ncbi:MAG: hypothetical protein S4CHLAM123_15140 [Chlamydiales bacterium]|nr:hypothetical protein [Chlamydiales bacterium]
MNINKYFFQYYHYTIPNSIYLGSRCLSSMTLNLYHFFCLKLNLGNKERHDKEMLFYARKGRVSLNIFLNFPSQILTPSVPHPKQDIPPEWTLEKIKKKAQKMINHKNRPDFLEYNPDLDPPSLTSMAQSGLCGGITTDFIFKYQQFLKETNYNVEKSACFAANLFKEGVSEQAELLQYIHITSNPNKEQFTYNFFNHNSLNADPSPWYMSAKSNFGHQLLGGSIIEAISSYSLPDLAWYNQLSLGSYGLTLCGPYNELEDTQQKHGIALIKSDTAYYIFDPNYGLLKFENPTVYFEKMFQPNGDYSFMFASHIEYNNHKKQD